LKPIAVNPRASSDILSKAGYGSSLQSDTCDQADRDMIRVMALPAWWSWHFCVHHEFSYQVAVQNSRPGSGRYPALCFDLGTIY